MRDKDETRSFYQNMFGASTGREAEKWIDFNFFGHQLSFHLKPEAMSPQETNQVDGKTVPVRHSGIILNWADWHMLADNLKKSGVEFIIEPYIRFEGRTGEQATMFFLDPSGNALEFKSFKDTDQIFAK